MQPLKSLVPCHIDRLPFELLSEVFILLDQAISKERNKVSASEKPVATFLSRVSRRWRSVACATSVLWSRIRMSTMDATVLHRAALWAARSGQHPISLEVDLSQYRAVTLALHPFHQHLDRITALDIRTQALSQLPCTMRNLRRLRFRKVTFDNSRSVRAILAGCTQLEYLNLSTCYATEYEGWMTHEEIYESRAHWIALPRLQELVLPPNALAERVRRYLIAPNLQGTAICADPELLAKLSDWRNRVSLQQYCPDRNKLYPLVPELEMLTVVNGGAQAPNNCTKVLSMLGNRQDMFPLPDDSLPDEEWTRRPRPLLPRLHTVYLLQATSARNRTIHLQPLLDRLEWSWKGEVVRLKMLYMQGDLAPSGCDGVVSALRAGGAIVQGDFLSGSI